MNSIALGMVVFICLFGAALTGSWARSRLPDTHLNTSSTDVIKLATAIVGTLYAIALGLLIASSKNTFDNAESELTASAANLVLLDRVMAHYGPELDAARQLVRKLIEERLEKDSSSGNGGSDISVFAADIEPIQDHLRSLSPTTFAQRSLQARALEVSSKIAEDDWLLAETEKERLPGPFIVMMVFWLSVLFATFGLLAPRNGTVAAILCVCALSVSGAVYLVMEMSHPFAGLIQIPDAPLRQALEYIGKQ
jgi:hypothetical protein